MLVGMKFIFLLVALSATVFAKPRNIMWFINDQQSNLQWFPSGWRDLNTPLTNKLEKNGIRFTSAYTNANMCSSARACMFTGQHVAQHQVGLTLTAANYQSPWESMLHPKMWNAATMMRDNGYDVVYFGKWHMSKGYFNATSDNPTTKYVHDNIARYGFGTLNGNDEWNGEPPLGTRGTGGFGGGYSDLDYWATQNATAWVKRRLEAEAAGEVTKPFFLIVSIWNPHDAPIAFPGQPANATNPAVYNTTYKPKWESGGYTSDIFDDTTPPISLPPTTNENLPIVNLTTGANLWTVNTTIKPSLESYFKAATQGGLGPCLTSDCKQKYLNMYANCIKLAEERFEQFYNDTFMSLPGGLKLLNDTIIVKTADHGDMTMAHGGQRQKPFMSYRESLQVNLVWSNPVLWPKGVTSNALVSHIDLIPTMLDYVGVDPKKYSLPGVSYKPLFTSPTSSVQDEVLFSYNDHWATFDEVSPPALNQASNVVGFPQRNVSNGVFPAPANIWVMDTKTHTVAIYYDQQELKSAEQTVCYDNTPEGGDYDKTYKQPLQLINLSPWSVGIRKAFGIPQVGTPNQLKTCEKLIKKLRNKAALAFKPIPKFKLVQPKNLSMRFFQNSTWCYNQCVEILFWSQVGQRYAVKATIDQSPNGGAPMTTYLANLLVTAADMDGVPFALNYFPQFVTGSNGPVYFIANVPVGTDLSSLEIVTSYTPEQALSPNYRSNLPPAPDCDGDCPWNGLTKPSEDALAGMYAYFANQH